MTYMSEQLLPVPSTACVVITTFAFVRWRDVSRTWILAKRLNSAIPPLAPDLLFSSFFVSWPIRRAVSVSIWRDLNAIRSMGNSQAHVRAARGILNSDLVTVSSAVCEWSGNWRELLFPEPRSDESTIESTEPPR